MTEQKVHVYPHLTTKNNHQPNKLYAFPGVGLLIKLVLLIPVFIEGFFLGFAFFFFWVTNGFVVLFTGKYWDAAHTFFVQYMRFCTKICLYIYGLTDKYPGFNLTTDGLFTLDIPKPTHPNRFLAMPFFGPLVRILLLIPYFIFAQIMYHGSTAAILVSWFAVIMNSKFPESLYEFEHDTLRVSLATTVYLTALSDKYPSFSISMNHQNVKIALLIVGAIVTINDGRNEFMAQHNKNEYKQNVNQYYQNRGDYQQENWNNNRMDRMERNFDNNQNTF